MPRTLFTFGALSLLIVVSAQHNTRSNRSRHHFTKRPTNVDPYAVAKRTPFQIEESNQWKPIFNLPQQKSQLNKQKIRQPPKNLQHIVFTTEKFPSPNPSHNYVSNTTILVDDFGAPIKSTPRKTKIKFQQSKKNLDQYEVHEEVNEESTRHEQKYRYQEFPLGTFGRNSVKSVPGGTEKHHIHYYDSDGRPINRAPIRGSRLGSRRPH